MADQVDSDNGINTYLQVLSVEVPKYTKWEPERDVMFASSLFSLPGPLSLAITAYRNRLNWQIIVRSDVVDRLVSNIYSAHKLADIDVRPMKRAPIGFYQYQFHTAAPFAAPLMYADDFKKVDPLVGILGVLADIKKGESIVYQLSLKPATDKQVELGWGAITASDVNWWNYLTIDSAAEAATKKALGADEHAKYVPEIQRVAEDKLRGYLMQTALAIKVKTSSKKRADHLVEAFFPAFAPFEREGNNFL